MFELGEEWELLDDFKSLGWLCFVPWDCCLTMVKFPKSQSLWIIKIIPKTNHKNPAEIPFTFGSISLWFWIGMNT
jgi:hypothetical protein